MKQVLNRRKGCGNSPGNDWQREQLRCRVGYEGSKVVTGGVSRLSEPAAAGSI